MKSDIHKKIRLPSKPMTALLTENTNLMLKTVVSNRKKGYIFVKADRDKLSMVWFKDRINHYAKLLGIQKDGRITIPRQGNSIQASHNLYVSQGGRGTVSWHGGWIPEIICG